MGQPALRDIHLGEDLDAGHDRGVHLLGRGDDVAQQPVHADAHDRGIGLGLDVHIAGPALDRLPQHQIDKADDGRLVGGLFPAGLRLGAFFDGDGFVELRGGVVLHGHQVAELTLLEIRAMVDHLDGPPDVGGRADHGLDGPLHLQHDRVDRDHVQRIGHGGHQLAALLAQGDQAEPLGDALRQQTRDLGVDLRDVVERDVFDGEVFRQNGPQRQIVEQVQTDQHFAEPAAFLPLFLERLRQMVRRDQTLADQQIPQLAVRVGLRRGAAFQRLCHGSARVLRG